MNLKIIAHVDDESQQRDFIKHFLKINFPEIKVESFSSFKAFNESLKTYWVNIFDNSTGEMIDGYAMAFKHKENSVLFTGSYLTSLKGDFPVFNKTDFKLLAEWIKRKSE